MNDKRVGYFDILRIVSIFFVIVIHVTSVGLRLPLGMLTGYLTVFHVGLFRYSLWSAVRCSLNQVGK